jgi:uncharacterized repeat protein (TIGR03803 family)
MKRTLSRTLNVTCIALLAAFVFAGHFAPAASFQVLHGFSSNSSPTAPVIEGKDGAFYGTTLYGGTQDNGTVFRVTTNGVFTNLVVFNFANGAHPFAGLTLGPDGTLYGTTATGGPMGGGTVFRVTSDGEFATIGAFAMQNWQSPRGLTFGSDGFLYGITVSGGVFTNEQGYGYGTVFRIATNGFLTGLASFAGTNGWSPFDKLVEGDDGAFYGTTRYGGDQTNGSPNGYGTVFKVTTNGVLASLVSFAGTNGSYPFSGVVKGRDGMFYGTTSGGGTADRGTVYRVNSAGELTTLVNFDRNFTGIYPAGGLVEGNDGAFYGTTTQGTFSPAAFGGTLFRVTTNGAFYAVYSFAEADGRWPAASLVQASDGAFYGTCEYGGGVPNGGTVFRLDPAVHLAPPKTVAQGLELTFKGLPRTSYTFLRATNVSGPWSHITNVIPDTNGIAAGLDVSPPVGRAFYRTIIPLMAW